jgi:hypothetical protein
MEVDLKVLANELFAITGKAPVSCGISCRVQQHRTRAFMFSSAARVMQCTIPPNSFCGRAWPCEELVQGPDN